MDWQGCLLGTRDPVTFVLMFAGAVVDLVFLSIADLLGPYVYLLFGVVSAVHAVYIVLRVPETSGQTLMQIQAMFTAMAAQESA